MGSDYSHETLVQPTAHIIEPEEQPRTVGAGNNTGVGAERDAFVEEIVVQCPPVSNSRPRPKIQRTGSLPSRQPKDASSNPVQRSRTAPNLDPRSTPSTPKKDVRGGKQQASRVNRSRAISVSTESCTADEDSVPSSPATNVSTTLSPVCRRRLHSSSPREKKPSHSSVVRSGDRGDEDQEGPLRDRTDRCGDKHSYRSSTARSMRGGRDPVHTTSASPSKKTAKTPVQSPTRRGDGHYNRPTKGVVWGPSSTNWPPSIDGSTPDPTSRPACDRRNRLQFSPGESSQLTYVSDDECAAPVSTHLTGESEYYTPSPRNSEVSDIESVPPARQKGKRRASPLPPSSPPLSIDSSPRDPDSAPGSSRKKRRDRRSRLPGSGSGANHQEQTQPQGLGQSLGQDVCHCTGPCPSCHRPRAYTPQFHPFMFPPGCYPYSYFPQPHMSSGYHPTNYGPFPYSYPYAIPQQTEPIPSISSAQPPPPPSGFFMPPTLPMFPSNAGPTPHTHVPPAPAPPSSAPASTPTISTVTTSSSPIVNSPPLEPSTSQQVPAELLGALDRFYQPPQRSVKVIDPLYDPRSPYSKKSVVPAFPNR